MLSCVNDSRIDILYRLLEEYNELMNIGEATERYMKYLEIMEIKDKYLGKNNSIHYRGIERSIDFF